MSKKDFKNINTNHVYRTIENALAQDVQNKYIACKAHDTQETSDVSRICNDFKEHEMQGNSLSSNNKKSKLPRINMSFSPKIYDYIKTMSKVSGLSITEFVNSIIENHMNKHIDQYDKTIEIRNSLND